MKRQKTLENFFGKYIKKSNSTNNNEESDCCSNAMNVNVNNNSKSQITTNDVEADFSKSELPDCWTEDQQKFFFQQYEWLAIKNGNLGCSLCSKYKLLGKQKHIHSSNEWTEFKIIPNGSTKTSRQASLRKKMTAHFRSDTHLNILQIHEESKRKPLTKVIENLNKKDVELTSKIFNSVYYLVKKNRPMSDFPAIIELQKKNGIDIGNSLQSRFSAIRIVEHIAKEMKILIINKIIENNAKICIIIDEASTISKKSVLVIYLRVELYVTALIFLDLLELESCTANSIFLALINCLDGYGFNEQYLKSNLIGFCSDGASVMMGKESGVSTKLLEKFPNIIVWHCLNHRLQLVLDDAIKDIKGINNFKFFIDKLYAIYHQSPKNQRELNEIATDLGTEIVKIGRVLGPRWAACSLRTTKAVWNNYAALCIHFKSNEKFSGLLNRLTNLEFFYDLAIMIDILQEFSLLSEALQSRSINIVKANQLILRSINAIEHLKGTLGNYESKIENYVQSMEFCDIKIKSNSRYMKLPREKLLNSIKNLLKKRLIDSNHLKIDREIQIMDVFGVLYPGTWQIENIITPWCDGVKRLKILENILKYKVNTNDFRDLVDNVLANVPESITNVPESIKKARTILETVAVSSAEAERAFSLMNNIITEKRNCLSIEHLSDLMTINLNGPSFGNWQPVKYVENFLKSHRPATAAQRNVKEITSDENPIWTLLNN